MSRSATLGRRTSLRPPAAPAELPVIASMPRERRGEQKPFAATEVVSAAEQVTRHQGMSSFAADSSAVASIKASSAAITPKTKRRARQGSVESKRWRALETARESSGRAVPPPLLAAPDASDRREQPLRRASHMRRRPQRVEGATPAVELIQAVTIEAQLASRVRRDAPRPWPSALRGSFAPEEGAPRVTTNPMPYPSTGSSAIGQSSRTLERAVQCVARRMHRLGRGRLVSPLADTIGRRGDHRGRGCASMMRTTQRWPRLCMPPVADDVRAHARESAVAQPGVAVYRR